MAYSLRYFADIVRYHETTPCQLHKFTYPDADAAERVAIAEMPLIFAKYGDQSGYAIFDETGHCEAIGPGRG